MDFENFQFYRDNFDVLLPWAIGAGVGAFLPVVAFAAAATFWWPSRKLWEIQCDFASSREDIELQHRAILPSSQYAVGD